MHLVRGYMRPQAPKSQPLVAALSDEKGDSRVDGRQLKSRVFDYRPCQQETFFLSSHLSNYGGVLPAELSTAGLDVSDSLVLAIRIRNILRGS